MIRALHVPSVPKVSSAWCEDYMGLSVIESDLMESDVQPFNAILYTNHPFKIFLSNHRKRKKLAIN